MNWWMFLLVPAHPDCTGQSPESRKMVVVVVVVVVVVHVVSHLLILAKCKYC